MAAKPAKLGSQAQYAVHAGVSKGRVSQMKAAGLLVFASPGMVDFAATDARRAANADEAMAHARTARAVGAARTPGGELGGSEEPNELTEARTEKLRREIARIDIDLAKARGELVSTEAAVAVVFEAFRIVRDQLDGAAVKLAPELVMAESAEGAKALIEEEHRSALGNAIKRLQETDWFAASDRGGDLRGAGAEA